MRPGEWVLSAAFVAFVGLKIVEAALPLERWPLTHTPMFARRVAPSVSPFRIALRGWRHGGPCVELPPAAFGLTHDELRRQLGGPGPTLSGRCGLLGHTYNHRMRRPPGDRLVTLQAHVSRLPRPGSPATPPWIVRCAIPPAPRPR